MARMISGEGHWNVGLWGTRRERQVLPITQPLAVTDWHSFAALLCFASNIPISIRVPYEILGNNTQYTRTELGVAEIDR